jgi:hypothetical protein
MSDLHSQLADAEALAARLRLQIAQGTCAEVGHDWKHLGGCNAGCDDACICSVPVHECRKCGDCDYGDNAEADKTRANCEMASHDR